MSLVDDLRSEFHAALAGATSPAAARALRDQFLSRKQGKVTALLKAVGAAPAEERRVLGAAANALKQEIEAALVGGTVTTSNGTQSLTGVLSMRSSGMGWGEIAQKDGVNLGSITSQIHEAGDQGVSQSHTPEAEPENSADASSVEAGHENADTIDASAVNHSDNADLPPNVGRPDVDVERPEIERPDIVRPDIERPDLPGVDH